MASDDGYFALTGRFAVYQGETWSFQYTVSGDLTDLTGYTIRLMARSTKNAVDTLFSLATGGSGITISTATVTCTLTDDQTAALEQGMGVYDLFLESAGGTVTQLLYGPVEIRGAVTRWTH